MTLKTIQDLVETQVVIEVDWFVLISYEHTRSNVPESHRFADVWDKMPSNVSPKQSLSDSDH